MDVISILGFWLKIVEDELLEKEVTEFYRL